MENVSYSASSPYYLTPIYQNLFLDMMVNRDIPKLSNDSYWEITTQYNLRPDLLAFDLYQDGRLWWVFAQRNPNRLKDPIFDFVTGTGIYLPDESTIKQALGI
jgi:hypothetical protein